MSRVIAAFSQFFDGDGEPLSNGWLKFLVSGTNNTLKATYSDSDQLFPNANPIQLDGEGRCPNIFGQGIYKVISYYNNPVTNLPGAQLQEFDPVIADYSDGSGAGGNFAEWDINTTYQPGYIVIYNARYYRSITANNIGNVPDTVTSEWEEITFLRYYNANVNYQLEDVVIDSAVIYFSLQNNNMGNTPSVSPLWWAAVGGGAIITNWEENVYAFRPVTSKNGQLGDATHLIESAYFMDNGKIYLGDSQDIEIYHDSTDSYILSSTGDLYLQNSSSNSIFLINNFPPVGWEIDLNGNLFPTAAATMDLGSVTNPVNKGWFTDIESTNTPTINGADFITTVLPSQAGHSGEFLQTDGAGTLSWAAAGGGGLSAWEENGNDLRPVTTKVSDLGDPTHLIVNTYLCDGGRLYLGDGQDMYISYTGSASEIYSTAGSLTLASNNNILRLVANNSFIWEIRLDGTLRPFTSNSYDIGDSTHLINDMYFGDSGAIYFGDGQDMYAYHDGSNGYITNTTGDLFIDGNTGVNVHNFYIRDEQNDLIDPLSNSSIYITDGSVGGIRPSEQGHLILQARSTAPRDIIFATGTTPSEKFTIYDSGNIDILSGDLLLATNNKFYYGKDSALNSRALAGINSSDLIQIGDLNLPMQFRTNGGLYAAGSDFYLDNNRYIILDDSTNNPHDALGMTTANIVEIGTGSHNMTLKISSSVTIDSGELDMMNQQYIRGQDSGGTPRDIAVVLVTDVTQFGNTVLPTNIQSDGTLTHNNVDFITDLLPAQATHSGEYLTTDGAGTLSWGAVTALSTWENSGNILRPVTSGAGQLGDATHLIDDAYFQDNGYIYLGTGQDMHIRHDGTNGFITNGTGYLRVATTDILLDNNFFIRGYETGATVRAMLAMNSSNAIRLGNGSNQLDLYSNGTMRYNNVTLASGTIDTTSSQTITVVDGLITAIA